MRRAIARQRRHATTSATPIAAPKLEPRRRRPVLTLTGLVLTGYAAATYGSLHDDRVRDFFVENAPLGETCVHWAEDLQASSSTPARPVPRAARRPPAVDKATSEAPRALAPPSSSPAPSSSSRPPPAKVANNESPSQKQVEPVASNMTKVTPAVLQVVEEVEERWQDLVERAEAALGISQPRQDGVVERVTTHSTASTPSLAHYDATPLPLGFSPPPGYSAAPRQADPLSLPHGKVAATPLPRLAPQVASLSVSEPILGQLAMSIDTLSDFMRGALRLNARDDIGSPEAILDEARAELEGLGKRFETLKAEADSRLQREIDARAHQYEHAAQQQERALLDKLEAQEEGWRKAFDEQRQLIVDDYRAKLNEELQVQQEIINQRLREEVIAQGVELQRRWLQEVKARVEKERSGRLAKLGDLRQGLHSLESVTLANSEMLDESLHAHALWSAVRAADVASSRPDGSFLRSLQALADAADHAHNSAIGAILAKLPSSLIQTGTASTAALASTFTNAVAPRVRKAALLPSSGGCLAYLSSAALSPFLARRDGSSATGDDVSSVLARAQHHLQHNDLDAAVRECNQLRGWPKILMRDWLQSARAVLEVRQALEFASAQATLSSLQAV